MRNFLFLDVARVTGVAFGPYGERPKTWIWTLRQPGEDVHLGPGRLVGFLTDHVKKYGRPHCLGVELYMQPAAQPSQSSIIAQLLEHGGLNAWCSVSRQAMVYGAVNDIRMVVCGRKSWGSSEKTKEGVRQYLIACGLFDEANMNTNESDACAGHAWGSEVLEGKRPGFALTA